MSVLAAREKNVPASQPAPLANRLGIRATEGRTGRLLFRATCIHEAEYKRIAKLLHERRLDREHYIEEFVGHLRAEMKNEACRRRVYGRQNIFIASGAKCRKASGV